MKHFIVTRVVGALHCDDRTQDESPPLTFYRDRFLGLQKTQNRDRSPLYHCIRIGSWVHYAVRIKRVKDVHPNTVYRPRSSVHVTTESLVGYPLCDNEYRSNLFTHSRSQKRNILPISSDDERTYSVFREPTISHCKVSGRVSTLTQRVYVCGGWYS